MQQDNRREYRIPLFCFVTVLFWASLYTYVPILTSYVEKLGASHWMAGIIVGSYGFVQMLLRIPLGIISDRLHKRRMLITFGIFFSLISTVGLLVFKNLSLILIFRSFAGAAAATWVDFTILYSSYYKHEEATKAIGTMNFYNTIGMTAAMLVGGFVADYFGWSAPFVIGGIIGMAGFVLSFFLVEKYEATSLKPSFNNFKYVITDKTLICVSLLAILIQMLTFATVYGFTPVFANLQLHANKSQMGMLTVLSTLPGAFGAIIAGSNFMYKIGGKRLIMAGFALASIFTITIPFTNVFWLLVLTQIIAGFGRGLAFTLLMGLSIRDMLSERRATAMGLFQAVYGLGMFIGPVIMGFIGAFTDLTHGFIYVGIMGLSGIIFAKLTIKDA
jgi:MFS family permease